MPLPPVEMKTKLTDEKTGNLHPLWHKWLIDLRAVVNRGTFITTTAALPKDGSVVRAVVTDSTVVATGNFGAAVTGGGTNQVPVHYDGTAWRIG